MTGKLNGILLSLILLLCFATFSLFEQTKHLKKQRNIYQGNTETLLSGIKRLQVDSVTSAVEVKTLRLTVDEYRRYRTEDAEKIKRLGVKLGSLQMAARHKLEINAPLEANLKDSVIIRDTILVTVKTVEMNNPHLQINAVIENSRLSGNIHLPVSLHQAVWIEPKHRFLWWRWGTKAVHQTIASDNPYVEIKYSEVIEIQK